MTMVTTMSSTANRNLHHQLHTFNSENNNNLYDATFSPYLNGNNNNNNGELSQKLNPFIIKSSSSPLQKIEKSGEIGVFGAEKYFNVEVVTPPRSTSKYQLHHQRDHELPTMAVATRKHTLLPYGTPSIRSESTTCNSQSALLQSGMNTMMRNTSTSRRSKKSVLSGLGFKCSCSDKDSVDADEISFSKPSTYGAVLHGKTTTRSRKLVDIAALDASHSISNVYLQKQESSQKNSFAAFSSPLSSASGNYQNHHVSKIQQQHIEEAEKPRNSIEVFGSPVLKKNRLKSLSFDRTTTRFVMSSSSRDGTPRLEEMDHNSNHTNINDAASDASSDLFEIESIKSKTSYPFLARQASDAASSSCLSPTNGYAPSEASIEWSVATASAAVMSDCEEQMSEVTIRSPIRTTNGKITTKGITRDQGQRRRPRMLLGCKSHKSVRVAGDAYITYENPSSTPKVRSRSNSISQVARFPSETTKLGNFGAKHGQQHDHHHAYDTPRLQHSHSPHASKLLYI